MIDWEQRDIGLNDAFKSEFSHQFKPFVSGSNVFYAEVGIGEGWWQLMHDLCAEVDALLDTPELKEHFRWTQVKEKFGGLRAYFTFYDGPAEKFEALYKIIAKYEEQSLETCEECGAPGKSRPTGWIRVLCDEHLADALDRQEQLKFK